MTVYEKENGTVKGEGKETFYVYGSGLIYEKTGDSILYHHYNNLGSTILLTTGTFAYKEVVDIIAHDGVTELAHVTITPQDELSVDGDQGATAGTDSDASESETIDSTTNHPYFVVGYGYVDAGNLRTGDTILLANGEKGTVKSVDIEFLEEPVTVYNFEVKDWHCYFVGEVGLLVHNMQNDGCGVAAEAAGSAAGNAAGKTGGNSGKGGSKYVKASFWERIRTKTAKVGDINPNPLDEFSNPKIGPNESAVSRYIKEINTNGTISEPIEVQKLSSGGYEIVNGHHRWLAAIKTGLKEVPIKIVNYEN